MAAVDIWTGRNTDPSTPGRYTTPQKTYGVPESERDLAEGAPLSNFDWEAFLSGPLGYLTRPGNQNIPMAGQPGVPSGAFPTGSVPTGIDPGIFASPQSDYGWAGPAVSAVGDYLTRPGDQFIPCLLYTSDAADE